MNERVDRVLLALDILVAAMVDIILILTGFWNVGGIKLFFISVMTFLFVLISVWNIQYWYIGRSANEKRVVKRRTSWKSSVPGILWYKVRFSDLKPRNRYSGNNLEKIPQKS